MILERIEMTLKVHSCCSSKILKDIEKEGIVYSDIEEGIRQSPILREKQTIHYFTGISNKLP